MPRATRASCARRCCRTRRAAAYFLPLVDTAQPLEAHIADLNADAQRRLPDVAVLGMGEDGHTASIFADAPEWDFAISTPTASSPCIRAARRMRA